MADIKVSALTNNTDPQDTDELYLVDDPGGTPASNSLELGQAHRYAINTANVAAFSATGYSLTGSDATSAIDIAGTWNTTGTPTALKVNVTDTASNAASLLMDLQVGGTSKFRVAKDGAVTFQGNSTVTSVGTFAAGGTGAPSSAYASTGIYLASSAIFRWSSTNTWPGTADTFILRKAAASLQLGAADAASPVAQTLGVQSVVAGTTNTAGANFTIKASAGTGSANSGSIILQVAPAGASGTAQNAFATALTIDSTKLATFAGTAKVAAGSASVPGIAIGDANTGIYNAGSQFNITVGGTDMFALYAGLFWIKSATARIAMGATADVNLYRDGAANTLALRNGTNAQVFSVYNTYTDASNYEKFSARWVGNVLHLSTLAAGTGTARVLSLNPGYNAELELGSNANTGLWAISLTKTIYPKGITQATTMTNGFINIPGAAGAPTGTPATTTGYPLYWDSTNNKLYVYDGGWLSTAALT